MDDKLYRLMNWPLIEGVIYAEEDHPHDILGIHKVGNQLLFQAFFPDASAVNVLMPKEGIVLQMELADEDGFFAALMPYRTVSSYQYEVILKNDNKIIVEDPYRFHTTLTESDLHRFHIGIHETIYEKLGAHSREIEGVKGFEFAVWAPSAVGVSVVGTFNDWNGKLHQMQRLDISGIFTIFIPNLKKGELYKYEIRQKNGTSILKADPYAFRQELRPGTASEIVSENSYIWHDEEWLENRLYKQSLNQPISIYEIYLGSLKKPKDGRKYYNYRDYADVLIKYIKKMEYTHVELMPIMEYQVDGTLGYQTIGYYAPTARYGDIQDFKYLIDALHTEGIGIILDWVPSYFPKDEHGLVMFDGSPLYEIEDERRRYYHNVDMLFFDFSKREVTNYLLANALYWIEVFHIDGIRMVDVSSMLYLNYGSTENKEITNIYGNNLNLEAIEFLKHLNAVIKKRNPGVITIAEEITGWPGITLAQEDGLGFDFKWNDAWKDNFTNYMQQDPFFRSYHHNELTDSLLYTYFDRFVLPFSHKIMLDGKPSLYGCMPGRTDEKFANLRLAYTFMMMHPGRKLVFMGQDLAEPDSFNENRETEWYLQACESNYKFQKCIADLNHLYRNHSALYQLDDSKNGFNWVDSMNNQNCCLTFYRNSFEDDGTLKERLLIVCNFANVMKITAIGVPHAGKYKEIFNTEKEIYGGTGFINARVKTTQIKAVDGHPYSFKMNMAPLSVSVFQYLF